MPQAPPLGRPRRPFWKPLPSAAVKERNKEKIGAKERKKNWGEKKKLCQKKEKKVLGHKKKIGAKKKNWGKKKKLGRAPLLEGALGAPFLGGACGAP